MMLHYGPVVGDGFPVGSLVTDIEGYGMIARVEAPPERREAVVRLDTRARNYPDNHEKEASAYGHVGVLLEAGSHNTARLGRCLLCLGHWKPLEPDHE